MADRNDPQQPGDARQQRDELREQRLRDEAGDAQAQARRKRTTQLAALAAFGAVIVIAALIAISQSGGSSDSSSSSSSGGSVLSDLEGIPQSNTVLGDPSAPVTVTEFGDLQCPICREFAKQTAPTLIASEVKPGNVKYDFKQWTIIAPQSNDAAAAAYAAGEQDKYWDFILTFYDQQQAENSGYVSSDFLEGIAKDAGVPDLGKWNADRTVAKWKPTIDATDKEASALGFSGTPSILVEGPNGKKPIGGSTIPTLDQIEAAIAQVQ
jgi:protein-disulfide isomerase